ncbi:hypothetical protein CONLIGDRAFT_481115 [Coniochaeta ligniaria NRRL 30616]|uniref:Uncharacterized protein n=1 Tax=Coniochaeta ligniaria NRRL 30616 TaxID=1408157 RepID=A0A1J7IZU5_9PEZI|nr:hypothetical protein CONLIGDRAFT_481115 [Coniochaeta ligniaria NRRL 30616]
MLWIRCLASLTACILLLLELRTNTAEQRVIVERHPEAARGQLMRDGVEELLNLSSMLGIVLRSVAVEGREELRDVLVHASLGRKPGGRQGMLLRFWCLGAARAAGALAVTAFLIRIPVLPTDHVTVS